MLFQKLQDTHTDVAVPHARKVGQISIVTETDNFIIAIYRCRWPQIITENLRI